MKRILVPSVLLLVILGGCGPSTEDIQKALSQTQTAAPTDPQIPTPTPDPTPTPVPLNQINLEELVVLPGDLPAGYSPAQVSDNPPGMFDNIHGYANAINQQFEREGSAAGGVTILLFDSISKATTTYDVVKGGFGESVKSEDWNNEVGVLESPGERASFVTMDMRFPGLNITTKMTDLVFIRCHAVVHIRISDSANLDYAVNYGARLDDRLTPLVCP